MTDNAPWIFLNNYAYMLRLVIIAKWGPIARLSYNTSFGQYEKVDFLTFVNFLSATQKLARYRFLNILR